MGNWTQQDIDAAKWVLRGTPRSELAAACVAIGQRIGRKVTLDALQKAMRRHSGKPPTAYMWHDGVAQPADDDIAVTWSEDDEPRDTDRAPPPEQSREEAMADREAALLGKDAPRGVEVILDESAGHARERRLKAEHSALVDRLREAEERARILEATSSPTTPSVIAREARSGLREGTAVALASDWHVEETVDRAAVAGRNEYNLAIAERRARRYFTSLRWLLEFERSAFTLRDLVLWLGGDLITGFIHPELAESNELSPVEAVLFVKRLLTDGIATLLADKKLERLIIPCSYGNHGRTTEKRRIKTGAENSYEWLLYSVMASEWAHEPRVTFAVDKSAHQYVDVYGKTLHFTHGDSLNYGGGVGGLAIPLNKRVPMWDRVRRAEVHHIGHFHQYLDLGHTVCNGSLIGYTDFAMSIGATYEPPRQAFYVYDAKYGKCLTTPVWVEDGEPA